MLVTVKKNQKKHQSPVQKRFEKLQKKLDRQKRLNQRFQIEMDELTNTFRQHTRETDQKQLDTLIALATKLIEFASRKSLSEWHRNELRDWTEELVMQRIALMAPETAKRLHQKYEESIAHVVGLSVEEFQKQIREIFEDDKDDQDDIFEYDEFSAEPSDHHDETYDETYNSDIFGDSVPSTQVMDSAWVKTLFRRTAQTLHPDREPDNEKRHHKQKQLSELLTARKENDLLTMIKIFSETFNGREIQLAEKEMAAICEMLEDQLNDLEFEQHAYALSNPERHLAYELLYHSNKKKRQEAIELWKQNLEQETKQNKELVKSLKNLAILKDVLQERRSQHHEFVDWLFDDIPF